MKCLTVAVPAYNAAEYLKKNIESMMNAERYLKEGELETFLDVLIVDDGSSDSTFQLSEELRICFPEIVRVIHKENGGHGSGINTGIQNALGKYFKVIDADDWVDPEAFAALLCQLSHSEEDIVYSKFYWAIESKVSESFRLKAEFTEPFSGVRYGERYSFAEICENLYIKMHSMTIRTELLRTQGRNIDEHCFYVDTEFVLFPIPQVKTILFLDKYVYMYRLGRSGQSMSPEKMRRNEAQFDRVLQRLFGFYEECSRETAENRMELVKLRYIESFLARIYAGRCKILLGYPASGEKKKELLKMEEALKNRYPKIFQANGNRVIRLLRSSGYILYPLATYMLRLKNRFAPV